MDKVYYSYSNQPVLQKVTFLLFNVIMSIFGNTRCIVLPTSLVINYGSIYIGKYTMETMTMMSCQIMELGFALQTPPEQIGQITHKNSDNKMGT